MKRMKVTLECEFEFPDDYSVAPDHDGMSSLKMGRKIYIPALNWMEQTVFLGEPFGGKYETAPTPGFQPIDKETRNEIMSHCKVEGGRVEMNEK
jgi:hypothetical protein